MKIEYNVFKQAVDVAIKDDGKNSLASLKDLSYNYLAVLNSKGVDIHKYSFPEVFNTMMDYLKVKYRLIDLKALCNPNYPDIVRLNLIRKHPFLKNDRLYNLDKVARNIDYHSYTYKELISTIKTNKVNVA